MRVSRCPEDAVKAGNLYPLTVNSAADVDADVDVDVDVDVDADAPEPAVVAGGGGVDPELHPTTPNEAVASSGSTPITIRRRAFIPLDTDTTAIRFTPPPAHLIDVVSRRLPRWVPLFGSLDGSLSAQPRSRAIIFSTSASELRL